MSYFLNDRLSLERDWNAVDKDRVNISVGFLIISLWSYTITNMLLKKKKKPTKTFGKKQCLKAHIPSYANIGQISCLPVSLFCHALPFLC